MVVCFLLVLLPSYTFFRFYRVLKNTFYPSIQLPAHIQEVGLTNAYSTVNSITVISRCTVHPLGWWVYLFV